MSSIVIDLSSLEVKIFIIQITEIKAYYKKITDEVIVTEENDITEFCSKEFNILEENFTQGTEEYYCHESYIHALLNEKKETLNVLKYQTLCMFLSMQYQLWDQQLSKFILTKKYTEDAKIAYGKLKTKAELYKDNGYDITSTKYWKDINLLRLIVNVIKHGDGDSLDEIERNDKELVNRNHHTLAAPINTRLLNINETHFERFSNTLLNFWEHIKSQEETKRDMQNENKV